MKATKSVQIALAICLITVPAFVQALGRTGDANGDYVVDAADVFYFVDYLAGRGAAPRNSCDMNSDGRTDNTDLDLLSAQVLTGQSLASSIIGTNGGLIKGSNGFKIEIPAGTFNYDTKVTIRETTRSATHIGSSSYFLIEGLSADIAKDIKVSIPIGATTRSVGLNSSELHHLASGNTYVSVDGLGLVLSELRLEVTGAIREAEIAIEEGKRVAKTTIKALTAPVGNTVGIFSLAYDINWETPKKHFTFFLNESDWKAYEKNVRAIGDALDRLYEELPVDFNMAWSTSAPKFRVVFKPLKSATKGRDLPAVAVSSKLSSDSDFIEVNDASLATGLTDTLKGTLAHELMHLLQNHHDPRYFAPRRNLGDWYSDGGLYLWWHEAVAAYMESYYALGRNVIPGPTYENMSAPLDGLFISGSLTEMQDHGYGLASMVAYLVEQQGPSVIGKIYQYMTDHWHGSSTEEHPVDIILRFASKTTPSDLSWWHDYLSQYFQGRIFPDSKGFLVGSAKKTDSSVITPTWSIGTFPPGRTLLKLPDLSAKLYYIKNSDISPMSGGQALTFAMPKLLSFDWWYPGDGSVMAFKLDKTGTVTTLSGDGADSMVSTNEAPSIVNGGEDIFAMVFNNRHVAPFTEKSDFEFYAFPGENLGATYNCAHAAFQIRWGGIKNVFRWHQSSGTNLTSLGDFPAVGQPVSVELKVQSTSCEMGHEYSWCYSILGRGPNSCLPVTCGGGETVTDAVIFDRAAADAGISMRYQDKAAAGEIPNTECMFFISPFIKPSA